jgi:hypothetical protein
MNELTKEALQERSLLVRAWEAACKIEHPSPDEANFRIAIAKKLGTCFNLREMRAVAISGPVPPSAGRK